MEISSSLSPIDPAQLSAEKLAGSAHISEADRIGELSRQFEMLLLRQILKDAQKTVIKSDLTSESVGKDIYQDMITNQLAESITQSGSLGFAQALEKQLTRQLLRPKQDHVTSLEN